MSEQREVVILSGVRTAIGDYGGSLKDIAPPTLPPASSRKPSPGPRSTRRTSASACSAT